MIWIGNVRGRHRTLLAMLEEIHRTRGCASSEIGICGDLILKGINPVECIMIALDAAKRIVIGHDTYHLFNAMHGDKDSLAYLKQIQGGTRMIDALKPYESLVYDLYNRVELMYRDPEYRFVVTPSSIHKGFTMDKDSYYQVGKIMAMHINHDDLVARMDKANIKQLITPALSYQKGYPYIPKDDIFYLNRGMDVMCATADLSESNDGTTQTFLVDNIDKRG